ncbi:uncharacterized protein DSM5745_01416 [Aspergillus mulundensis]|uniref:Uncharacterized protein n=1 Tax=Aspergillus mulundensis TaxID=1810919 RepID=A0A3D8T6E3_9EURO|nr:hypothetical protein DSM5745_01416 [Aspergillus mulundensis]RDW94094.1 hypothetical protein DSM5745_01416 [Aspergillus mulundensis]
MESLIFAFANETRVVVCQKCGIRVRPSQIEKHLKKSEHRLNDEEAATVAAKLFQWPGVPVNDDDIDVPKFLYQPIHPSCRNVCRSVGSLAVHYKSVHNISTPYDKAPYRTVSFQQLFTIFAGSHYIPIIGRTEEIEITHCTSPTLRLEHFLAYATGKLASDDAALKDAMSQRTDGQEQITWMGKTQWDKYLQGVHLPDLLEIVAAPAEDVSKPSERAMRVIWDAVDQLIQQSQMVVQTCGADVQVTATRLSKGEIPLNTCMDNISTRRAVRLWQEIVVCLGRVMNGWRWREAKLEIFFTKAQRAGWKQLWLSAQDEAVVKQANSSMKQHNYFISTIEARCLHFCLELLIQPRKGHNVYEYALPETYTRKLSGLIQVAQSLVVYNAFCMDPSDKGNIFQSQGKATKRSGGAVMAASGSVSDSNPYPCSSSSTVLSPSDADGVEKRSLDFRDSLAWAVNRLTSDQWVWPMDILLDWHTFGSKIGDFQWHGPNTLFYRQVKYTMNELRGLVYRLVRAAKDKLDWAVGGSDAAWPVIPWSKLHEDPMQEIPGWSFLKHGETPWPVDGTTWLSDRLASDPWVHNLVAVDHVIDPTKVIEYFQQMTQFRVLLCIIVHMIVAAPARVPELLVVRHKNTEAGLRWNVFIEDQQVVIVTAYHHGRIAGDEHEIMYHYLPREVGELLVRYLWLVQPFVRLLCLGLAAQRRTEASGITLPEYETSSSSPYLWGNDSERLLQVLRRETGTQFQLPEYSRILMAIKDHFLRAETGFLDNGHMERQEHAAMHLEDPDPGHRSTVELDATHSSHIAGLVYAREVCDGQSEGKKRKRQMLRTSSTNWHQFLGFPSAKLASVLGKRSNAPCEAEENMSQMAGRSGCSESTRTAPSAADTDVDRPDNDLGQQQVDRSDQMPVRRRPRL